MKTLITEDTLWGSLDIVNMVRRYQFFSMREASTSTSANSPSPQDAYANAMSKFIIDNDKLYESRSSEFISMMKAFKSTKALTIELSRQDVIELLDKLTIELSSQDVIELRDKLSAPEFMSVMKPKALTIEPSPQDEDRMWSTLRMENNLKKSEYFKIMEDFTSRTGLTFSPFPQDEDKMRTLINLLNMLSWYKFDPTMKASTSTMAASASHEEDNKWRLKTQVLNLFNEALKDSFHEFTEKCMMFCSKNDIQCDNILSIWPKIKKEPNSYPDIKGPKDVGERIKKGLVKLKSPILEGEPCVYGVGFVKIKLSGNWMAKNIHKMLRDGIDTWAPSQQLDLRSTIVNSPSWDEFNLMPMDVLRRQFIIMSRMHMLEYVKSAATTSSGNGMSLPQDKLDEHFRVVEEDGEVLIYDKDEGNKKPIIRGKSRTGKSRDEGVGYPLEDLGALWHGLQEANWIMCVTPSQQQDYVEKCFDAAEHARWTTDSLWPLATYVGFKTCSKSMEDLLSLLCKAKYPCEAGEAAKVLGYSDEAVLDCVLTYTFLKYHRLADCKFSYNEMFDVKGDTFVHLMTTQAQIGKITNHSRKYIDELKKASKLVLEEDKVVWCEGVERELGFHLLMFTELINESYLSFLPHLVCRYLYDLSEKFSRFYETYASLGFEEKTRLLLCEATAVVMEKGFHLLGITQRPSLQAASVALALNYVAPLEVRNPPKNPNIRTRFEVFTIYLNITRDQDFKHGKLFGWIEVLDYYGLRPDGWEKILYPGGGRVSLFSRDCCHSIEMRNKGRLKIGNPSSRHSVPFSSSMQICILLYATTENNDEFFEVCNHPSHLDFSTFLGNKSKTSSCEYLVAGGDDGHIRMHYILLKDAVDATIKVKLVRVSDRSVCGVILAYYDKFDYGDDKLVESFYKASLFESFDGSFKGGDVPLTRSILAVPSTGSLIIEARLTDFESGNVVLYDRCVFCSNREGSFKNHIKNKDNTLEVEITWSED